MTIHVNKLIELLARLCENKNLKAAGAGSLKGGVVTGISAALGGLLFGPVGLAIGGALGGIGSAVSIKDFKPVAVILRDMDPKQKQKLADTLTAAFCNFGIEDIITLSTMLTSNSSFQSLIIKELVNFFNKEMNLRIQNA